MASLDITYEGYIAGPFRGFKRDALFKMRSGSYWVQAEYEYWYHYAYCPKATIAQENGRYVLTVADRSVLVKRVKDVVESKIVGLFTEWTGDSQYSLVNGQAWKQSSYKFEWPKPLHRSTSCDSPIDGFGDA